MSRNDQILIEQVIKQEFGEKSDSANEDEFFEFYTSSQILKDFDLSYDEIESGLCGASLDGGADAIYVFVNGELIDEDMDLSDRYKRNVNLDLYIIQSKNEKSFGEDAVLKLSRLSKNLLDLEFDATKFKNRYNDTVISRFELFRRTYFSLITKKPNLNIRYYYITKGIDLHPNVEKQIEDLKVEISSILTESKVHFETIGATKLLEIYRKRDNEVFSLKLAENPLSSQGKVFISLVNLLDFYKFISDENGNIIRHIFEANVRDYQGKTNVNIDIQETLVQTNSKEDFWWLNNGVTILASDVSAPGGKELIIHNPEIVNGLQTSNEIYRFFRDNSELKDPRSILVRVIVPEDEESRDKIIRATNSQTPIPKASLRATDSIHRDIEDYLKPRGLYYDRRKNFYKNNGKKPGEIISLPFLAQCVMSIMQKPDFARARPSTLLEDTNSYKKLYAKENDVKAYYIASLIGKEVESLLKSKTDLTKTDKNNVKFYIVYVAAVFLTNTLYPGFRSLAKIESSDVTSQLLEKAFGLAFEVYKDMGKGDKIAKGKDLIVQIKEAVKNAL